MKQWKHRARGGKLYGGIPKAKLKTPARLIRRLLERNFQAQVKKPAPDWQTQMTPGMLPELCGRVI
jgi:hypothetical protein